MLLLKWCGLKETLIDSSAGTGDAAFQIFPPFSLALDSPFVTMVLFLFIMWWAHHYADGGGYVIQRMASCKNEKHSLIATLFFAFTNMVRGWPWIMVALASSLVMAIIFLIGKHFWPEVRVAGFELATIPFYIKTLMIVPVSIVCWLTATALTEPEPQAVLNHFYRKVCPGGWWKGIDPSLIRPDRCVFNSRFVLNWFAGILFVFGATLGVGYVIFQSYIIGFVSMLFSGGGSWLSGSM